MKAKLGSGARFKALKGKLAARGDVRDPGALAAFIGRKKYGKTKFQALGASGRRTAGRVGEKATKLGHLMTRKGM